MQVRIVTLLIEQYCNPDAEFTIHTDRDGSSSQAGHSFPLPIPMTVKDDPDRVGH